ncbi:MAG: hypothetical protein RR446_09310 [Lachnospiraceae bacterium]
MEDKVQETLQSQIHQMEAEYEQMERQEKNIQSMEEEQERALLLDYKELEEFREHSHPEDGSQMGRLYGRQEILDSIRKKRADFLDMFHHEVQKKKQENSQRSEEWECQIRRQKETCKE